MIKQLKNWLNNPYYFNPNLKYKLSVCLGFGLGIFLFLYIFEPFRLYELDNNILTYSAGFGLVTLTIMLFTTIVLPYFFPRFFDNSNWTVGKQFLYVLTTTAIISVGNWGYNFIAQKGGDFILSLPTMIGYTLSIGIFPIFIYLFIDERLSRSKRNKIAEEINATLNLQPSKTSLKSSVVLLSDETKEALTINPEELIYIGTQGNYASVFLLENNTIKEKVIRTTLTKIEEELTTQKNIIRCHKSYIVNSNFIKSISGNARGYLLHSDIFPFKIPVSRKFKKEDLLNLIKN